jgi:16S rRNA (cytosine967-C5)-methyltransferase
MSMTQKNTQQHADRPAVPARPGKAAAGRTPSKRGPTPLSPSFLLLESLAFALDHAAQVLGAVRAGSSLPAALIASHAQVSLPAARGAIQDISYRVMRNLGRVDALQAKLLKKPAAPRVANLLACALTLLLDTPAAEVVRADEVPEAPELREASGTLKDIEAPEATEPKAAPYTAFTVVDQAVAAVGARRETAFAKGLVNAVLRGFLRRREALLAEVCVDPVARWSYPRWWIDALQRAWPEHWQGILEAGNRQAPLTLRLNRRLTDAAAYLDALRQVGLDAVPAGADALRLKHPVPVDRLPGFDRGWVSVQDAGAQLAAPALNLADGMRVLDACAAPGGKSGHLLELAEIDLVALESNPLRATRITETLARLRLSATVTVGDAGAPEEWYDGVPFDRILADVPCSATGIVRRHPDIRWLRRATDIPALVIEQRRILEALWPLLKIGGELLYVTCSILPEEGESQAVWFESSRQDAVRLHGLGQILPGGVLPEADLMADHDGFFYARFQKR